MMDMRPLFHQREKTKEQIMNSFPPSCLRPASWLGVVLVALLLGVSLNLDTRANADSPPLTVLHTFAPNPTTGLNPDGADPPCSLIAPGDGFLYGTTQYAGVDGMGSVFKVKPDGSAFQTLHFFTGSSQAGADGANPDVALLAPGDGFLYGTTERGDTNGHGTVFRIRLDGTGYQTIFGFSDYQKGIDLQSALIAPGDGYLYGTAFAGGPLNGGTVYRLHTDGTGFQLIHSFSSGDGEGPRAALNAPGDGFLYGTTYSGGSNIGLGTVYRLHPDGTGFQTLYIFGGSGDGANPSTSLVAPGDGFLYGTTQHAGNNGGYGSIFKIKMDGTAFQAIFTFTDGHPSSALSILGDGSFCGATDDGGMNGLGSLYRLHRDGSSFQIVYTFRGVTDGAHPQSSPLILSDGFLYGTTARGGENNTGTIFKVATSSTTHLLWTNPDGRATLWFVNPNGTYGVTGAYGPYADKGGLWKAAALATGPNGVSRLLWTNPDGRATLWFVNPDGTYGVTGAYGPYADKGGLWTAGALSVGPDNVAHILWTNPDGRATLWFVNPDNSYGVSGAYGPYSDPSGVWKAGALATGPDGVSRLLWTNPDGRATLWFVNPDASYGVTGAYGPYADTSGTWRARAVSVGPDNVAHILWNNPDGRATLWFVNPDASYGLLGAYGPYADSAGLWTASALATGLDGISHPLWTNPDGRTTLWFVNPGGAFGVSGAYGPYVDSGGVWRAVADSAGP